MVGKVFKIYEDYKVKVTEHNKSLKCLVDCEDCKGRVFTTVTNSRDDIVWNKGTELGFCYKAFKNIGQKDKNSVRKIG